MKTGFGSVNLHSVQGFQVSDWLRGQRGGWPQDAAPLIPQATQLAKCCSFDSVEFTLTLTKGETHEATDPSHVGFVSRIPWRTAYGRAELRPKSGTEVCRSHTARRSARGLHHRSRSGHIDIRHQLARQATRERLR